MPKTIAEIPSDMLLRQYNDRDISAVDDYIAEDHIDHNPMPGQQPGLAGVRALIQGVLDSTSDIRCEIHEVISERDLVCTRYTMTATHKGEFLGVPAAGKTTSIHIVEVDRVRDGKIVESWGESNILEALRELGALDSVGHVHS